MNTPPWLILDCDYLCHRAEHSMSGLKFKGRMTGVLYGFFKALLSLEERFDTGNVVFCFDSKIRKRAEIYPEYKAQRKTPSTREEAKAAVEYHHQIIKLRTTYLPSVGFNNILWHPGYEGDDQIAVAHQRIRSRPYGEESIIVTCDQDLYQLIDPRCSIFNPATEKTIDLDTFDKMYGIHPRWWALVKALGGCSSDNIVGAPGVGEKTALKFFKGELKHESKAYKSIHKFLDDGDKYVRNCRLITLPYPGCPTVGLNHDNIGLTAWKNLCNELGFSSLRLQPPRRDK